MHNGRTMVRRWRLKDRRDRSLFDQQGNQCMLQSEQEKGLSHLTGKWMSGPALQKAMVSAGINIFVNEHTDKYVATFGKVCIMVHCGFSDESSRLDSIRKYD